MLTKKKKCSCSFVKEDNMKLLSFLVLALVARPLLCQGNAIFIINICVFYSLRFVVRIINSLRNLFRRGKTRRTASREKLFESKLFITL